MKIIYQIFSICYNNEQMQLNYERKKLSKSTTSYVVSKFVPEKMFQTSRRRKNSLKDEKKRKRKKIHHHAVLTLFTFLQSEMQKFIDEKARNGAQSNTDHNSEEQSPGGQQPDRYFHILGSKKALDELLLYNFCYFSNSQSRKA